MTDFQTEEAALDTITRRMTDTSGAAGAPSAGSDVHGGSGEEGPQVRGPDADFSAGALVTAAARFRDRVHILRSRATGALAASFDDDGPWALEATHGLLATLPPVYPEWLGSREFVETHGVRFPYVAGAMAHGIASRPLVVALARAEMLAFFGAAGLSPADVEANLAGIEEDLEGTGATWGSDLIHAPHDPSIEEALVDLYLARGVRRVSASAFMRLTPAVVRYAYTGLSLRPDGSIHRPNLLFAKLSRAETAQFFMSPAPREMVSALVERGALSAAEAELGARVAVAEDITFEADSGGHTDNRPLTAVLPTLISLRDELQDRHGYERPVRVGAAGGIGTPGAVAAAFSLGAAYVMTGSVNQAAIEAGTSALAKTMLAAAEPTDVAMAPSPDMFEMGVKVQVLKRGTLFASRAGLLRQLYTTHERLEDIPAETVARIEREIFQRPLGEVWDETRRFFESRSPRDAERAASDPKHKMALVFRWYIGLGSHWAISGVPERKMDYQIWCGPAMGAFNRWVRGSFLAELGQRSVVQVALNLLEGAGVVTRAQQLRSFGLPVPDAAFRYSPKYLTT
jgi:trans-AT polyketide synthase/acyltransferase/oxidoreductase domain-containing protein